MKISTIYTRVLTSLLAGVATAAVTNHPADLNAMKNEHPTDVHDASISDLETRNANDADPPEPRTETKYIVRCFGHDLIKSHRGWCQCTPDNTGVGHCYWNFKEQRFTWNWLDQICPLKIGGDCRCVPSPGDCFDPFTETWSPRPCKF